MAIAGESSSTVQRAQGGHDSRRIGDIVDGNRNGARAVWGIRLVAAEPVVLNFIEDVSVPAKSAGGV